MHEIKFYPVGNGDCSQIILENGKRILLDYRQHSNGIDSDCPEIDLSKQLKNELNKVDRNDFDVVAFTHADKDHIQGCTEFFEFDHAKKYQADDRIKIKELWVPAAILIENVDIDKQSDEFVILRQEARHRFKNNYGIKVFSKPKEFVKWAEKEDIDLETRSDLMVRAGEIVDTLSLKTDGVEFFCHSPYRKQCDDNPDTKTVRNKASLIFNIRFSIDNLEYDMLAVGDSDHEVLEDIVNITEYHERDGRLKWNIFNIPHHCSYLALAPSGEKGDKKTIPTEAVKKLLEYGQKDSYMVCSSNPISNDDEAYEQTLPPHIQAKITYEEYLKKAGGRKFLVTMEEPSIKSPKPIVFEISSDGLKKKNLITSAAIITGTSKPSRAG